MPTRAPRRSASIKARPSLKAGRALPGQVESEKPRGAREVRSAARREAILNAALEEFSSRGFAAARLDDVAKRAGVAKGQVVARLQIDEKGNVTEVIITHSEPPRVFDKVVRAALQDWKFKAEGERYVGEVEINFSLKD